MWGVLAMISSNIFSCTSPFLLSISLDSHFAFQSFGQNPRTSETGFFGAVTLTAERQGLGEKWPGALAPRY
jgi:hypothetical protein